MRAFANRKNIYWAKIRPDALIPKSNVSIFDIYASFEEDYLIAYPYSFIDISTGLNFACSSDYYLQLNSSPSLIDYGLISFPQIVDYSCRDEIVLKAYNSCSIPVIFSIYAQDRIEKIANLAKKFKKYKFFPLSNAISQAQLCKVDKFFSREISLAALKTLPADYEEEEW